MSSYLQQQLSTTSQNSGAARQAILNQAFGSNAMATGVSDAAVGQSMLNAISGFTAGGAPGYAQPLAKGAASYNALFNVTNGLSMTQSAGMTSQLMSPQTAMNFMMLGLGKSAPLQVGGKVNTNAASMYEGLFQRLAPGENQNQLRYNLRSGGVLSSELGSVTGLSGQNLESFITSGLDVSKLQSEGLSTTKINQLMQQAGAGNRAAQNTLNKDGVSLTDLQAQKDVTATKTSRQASTEQSFSTGLQAASQSLVKFNNVINEFLKIPGINKLVGTASGYRGEAGTQGNILQTITGGITGGVTGLIGGLFSTAFGGGSSASPGQKTHTKTAGSSSGNSNASGVPPQAGVAVRSAESQLGVPYVWGGEQPGQGFDCSGLVQWAYDQAGVALPRTSQAQWALLHGRQVPLNRVQEGDILFAAGSDGTASAPGHEALMVSQKQLIQAPYTGQNVQIDPYDPSQWLYAARPAGKLSGSASGGSTTSNTSSTTAQGNAGSTPAAESGGLGLDPGNYGSVDELQAVQGALLGGISAGSPGTIGGGSSVSSSGGNTQSSSTSGGSGKAVSNTGSGWAILQRTAAGFGWGSGAEWTALKAIENQEDAGASPTIRNGAGSGALGIAQALGHGNSQTAGKYGNEYGGYGLTNAQAKLANSGNAAMQSLWMLNYIKEKFGDPVKAEAYHLAHNSYGGGTRNADPGWALVGERGPELMHLTGGQQIFNASQSAHIARQDAKQPQSHPYASMLSGNFSLPDSPAASPAGAAAAGGGLDGGITLQFNEGSIALGQGVTAQDARSFVQQVADAVSRNQTLQAIAAGDLHG